MRVLIQSLFFLEKRFLLDNILLVEYVTLQGDKIMR